MYLIAENAVTFQVGSIQPPELDVSHRAKMGTRNEDGHSAPVDRELKTARLQERHGSDRRKPYLYLADELLVLAVIAVPPEARILHPAELKTVIERT